MVRNENGPAKEVFLGFARTVRQLSLKTRVVSKVWGNTFKSAPLSGASGKIRRENKNVGDATKGGVSGGSTLHTHGRSSDAEN